MTTDYVKEKADFIATLGLSWHSGEGEFVVYDWDSQHNGTAWDIYVCMQTFSDDSFAVYLQAPHLSADACHHDLKKMAASVSRMKGKKS